MPAVRRTARGRRLPQGSRVGLVLLGKYLTAVLGQGGMGTVYEARHELVGRRFAIKLLNPELAFHEEIVRRFRREAEAALESDRRTAMANRHSRQANAGRLPVAGPKVHDVDCGNPPPASTTATASSES